MATATFDRSEKLLALILMQHMKSAPQREKVVQLNLAGFSNVEIADILETTGAVVSQSLYEARKGRKTPVRVRRKPKAT